MLIGYARVSTSMQDLQLQTDALRAAGCKKIFTDTASGKNRDRPGLDDALTHLRPGDCFVVWKLDRLGRNVRDMLNLAAELEQKGANLQSLTDKIDTSAPHGRFYFTVMSALAEMERDLMRERTKAGLEAAKRAGRLGGRPTVMTDIQMAAARDMLRQKRPRKKIAEAIHVSVPTIYRHFPVSKRRSRSKTK